MSRITVLSDDLVNKIAAGEVVERPASVVKELCENAVDAGAHSIRILLEGGGLEKIRVIDDGGGMTREEASLAILRHATSKLRDADGLFTIQTKGFRGEALPSIASVSRFSLSTAVPGAHVGTRVIIDGGAAPVFEEIAGIPGTDITVGELFFNTPARRKFLKREQTELGHCHDAVLRLALAHLDVAFHLEHDGKVIVSVPANPTDPRDRIAAALGSEFRDHLREVREDRLGLTVRGWVASPEHSMSTARGLYTFVNNRYVRDRGLNFSVQRGFHESLPSGRQPMAAIFVDVDPAAVDVNVHPQKLEVRFSDGRGVTDAVFTAISRALGRSMGPRSSAHSMEGTPQYAQAVERFLARATEAAWGGPLPLPLSSLREGSGEPFAGAKLGFGMARPDINSGPPLGFFSGLRWLGTLGKRFWICEGSGDTLVVLDSHAAWERFHLATFLDTVAEVGESPGHPTLFSKTITLEASDLVRLGPALDSLRKLGIEAEPFGGREVALKAMPLAVQGAPLEQLISELLAVLPPEEHRDGRWLPPCRILACHAAEGSARTSASHESLRVLFDRLDDVDFSVDPQHPMVVVQQTPFLDLAGRADVKRSVS